VTRIRDVLIVGGGTSGNALAILLSRAGVRVEIAELAPPASHAGERSDAVHGRPVESWAVLGSGITLKGNALRVLRELGVWEEVRAHGYGFDEIGMCAPDGTVVFETEDTRTGGPDLPATFGMFRPKLQEILAAAAGAAGVRTRFGRTVETLAEAGGGSQVAVRFSDGSDRRYDLVVGADGVRSKVRALLGIQLDPQPTGMGIWRVFARRPRNVRRTDLFYGGPCYIAGYCPVSDDHLYAYLVEPPRDRGSFARDQMPDLMRALAAAYGGAWREIRDDITDPDRINYTWFESLLVPPPWHRGRVVLIGDAAHACPPTLAQGAAMCLEDASVLAELLTTRDAALESVLEAFVARRYQRVRLVVDASLQLAEWQLHPTPDADEAGLIARTQAAVTAPP